jgi:hypothetical protein
MTADRLEYRSAHELVDLGEVNPAHFGQLLLVTDESPGPVSRAGCQVENLASRLGVDATAYDPCSAYPQACFLSYFAYGRVSGIFSRLDLACDKRPRRLTIIAPGHQDSKAAGNDGGNDRCRPRHGILDTTVIVCFTDRR